MKYCSGFFIVEFLVCLALFTYSIFFFMQFVVAVSHMMHTHSLVMQKNLTLLTGLEFIMHELEQAPVNKNKWLRFDPHFLIWKSDTKDVGIGLENKKIVRIKGSYDSERKIWRSKITNTIADCVENISFDYYYDEHNATIDAVRCTLIGSHNQQKKYTCSRLITLVNGYV